MITNYIGLTEWISFGYIGEGIAHCGLPLLLSNRWPNNLAWNFATYTRDAFYKYSNYTSNLFAWHSYGPLRNDIGHCGISCLFGAGIGGINWYYATKDIHIYINSI